MTLLVSVVFWNVVQIVSSDDDGTVHLGRDNSSGQDSTSDGNQSSEWTFLVDVRTLDSGFRGLESQTGILIPSLGSSSSLGLWVDVDVRLLLESSLRLDG